MRILVNGVNTINKGAELMFYAILQEIEKKFPDAEILYNGNGAPKGYFKTPLKIITPFWNHSFFYKFRFWGAIRIISKRAILPSFFCYKKVNIVFDASGYSYSDRFPSVKLALKAFIHFLKYYYNRGTVIVFLPQAFGPFTKHHSQTVLEYIHKYANSIIARDEISYNSIRQVIAEDKKLWLYPDFTVKVKGIIPKAYENKKDYITVIPNLRMVDKGMCKKEEYISFLSYIISLCISSGREVFVLNHEGCRDQRLCEIIAERNHLCVVWGLNALEVKGFISRSYLTISSRFHGVVNSLNTGVPCLATSWSHKYEMLFKDFNLEDCMLKIDDYASSEKKVKEYLRAETHKKVECHLNKKVQMNIIKTEEMWSRIWALYNK